METPQRRVLLVSVLGIVAVVIVLILVGRSMFVNTVKPAVQGVLNSVSGGNDEKRSVQTVSGREFTTIEADGGWDITVNHGSSHDVRVNTPASAAGNVRVETANGRLLLGVKSGTTILSGKFSAQVQMPSLEKVDVRGGANVTIEGFSEPSISLGITGAGNITGSGNDIDSLSVYSAGATNVDFRKSQVRNARVNLQGAGHIVLTMTGGTLTGSLDGLGKIDYYGTVSSQNVQINGLGAVENRGDR